MATLFSPPCLDFFLSSELPRFFMAFWQKILFREFGLYYHGNNTCCSRFVSCTSLMQISLSPSTKVSCRIKQHCWAQISRFGAFTYLHVVVKGRTWSAAIHRYMKCLNGARPVLRGSETIVITITAAAAAAWAVGTRQEGSRLSCCLRQIPTLHRMLQDYFETRNFKRLLSHR